MKTILVPTDFSSPAQNAVHYAAKLARTFNSRLVILNVYSPAVAGIEALPVIDSLSDAERTSVKMLEALKQEIIANTSLPEVICISRIGTIQELITEIAEIYKAEAI
ncbi:MAG: universal stress protein, partial [Bacteroidia bacterium]|nr:universal stress protein [Bacteroidia bacterium]